MLTTLSTSAYATADPVSIVIVWPLAVLSPVVALVVANNVVVASLLLVIVVEPLLKPNDGVSEILSVVSSVLELVVWSLSVSFVVEPVRVFTSLVFMCAFASSEAWAAPVVIVVTVPSSNVLGGAKVSIMLALSVASVWSFSGASVIGSSWIWVWFICGVEASSIIVSVSVSATSVSLAYASIGAIALKSRLTNSKTAHIVFMIFLWSQFWYIQRKERNESIKKYL